MPAAIGLFRSIAAKSADALVMEGQPHPDHRLLALCADALDELSVVRREVEVQAVEARERAGKAWPPAEGEEAWRAAQRTRFEAHMAHYYQARALLRAIAKVPATTPAGIYAKAQVCRASRTGAPGLATSMVEDLLACRALRAVIWPSGDISADAGDTGC
jgi:hypothetical protein